MTETKKIEQIWENWNQTECIKWIRNIHCTVLYSSWIIRCGKFSIENYNLKLLSNLYVKVSVCSFWTRCCWFFCAPFFRLYWSNFQWMNKIYIYNTHRKKSTDKNASVWYCNNAIFVSTAFVVQGKMILSGSESVFLCIFKLLL